MSRRVVSRVPLYCLLLIAGIIAPRMAAATPPMQPGELIIKFKATALQSEKDSILAALSAIRIRHFPRIQADHNVITGVSVEQAINRFRGHRAIQYIEPNYVLQADSIPNDPSFGQLWGLHNTGQFGGVAGADISAVDAWNTTTGSRDIVVAIIDTGIDYNHPDLAENIWVNTGEIAGNFIDDDGNGFVDDARGWDFFNFDNDPFDDAGHGTHVAGTVGAVGNNGVGVVGVSWRVRLMPLKFLGSGGFGSTAGAIACVEYATMMGVRIMSNSWGGGGYSDALREAIQDANSAGILFVAAAGNSGLDSDIFPHYPAGYDVPNIISVAATTPSDDKAAFSTYGLTTVDLGAPGTQVYSTTPSNTYSYFNGTSMATPHVSGALALVLSRFPALPVSDAKTLLLNSTDPLPSLQGLVVSGGRLNAARALEGPDSIPPDPIANLSGLGTGSNRITLSWTATGDDGAVGRATGYDLRFATFVIDEANFNTATRFLAAPGPLPAGSSQQAVVGGLSPSTTYYFAIKAHDEYSNPSPISNSASATTLMPPEIDVTPTSLSASLVAGGTDTRTVTLRNLTAGTLDFQIDATPDVPGAGGAGSGGTPPAGLLTFPWSDYVRAAAADSTASAAPPEGALAGAVLAPVITDPAGDGGLVDLIEMRASSNHDSLEVEMEFSTPIDRLNFGGFLALDTDQNPLTGAGPSFGNGAQDVGAEFEIQFFRLGSGVVSVYHAPTRTFLGTFAAAVGPRTIRFRVPLSSLGSDDGSMNVAGVIGDDFGPTDWFPDSGHGSIAGIRWVAVSPSAGTVPPGGTQTLLVTFDSGGLLEGAHDASIRIANNDPDEPEVIVAAHLDVSGTPRISLSNTDIDFGSVQVGASRQDSIMVSNVGTGRLEVTEVSSDHPAFVVITGPFGLNPGEGRAILVAFTPSGVGSFFANLTVLSNDPEDGALFGFLSGTGLVPPDISVSPSSLSALLQSGETAAQTLTIANTGASGLSVQISVQPSIVPLTAVNPPPADPSTVGSQTSTTATPAIEQTGLLAPASVLVIQDTDAWDVFMNIFLLTRFGITPTVIPSSQIAATDFSPYDLIITVGDEFPGYYGLLAFHQAKFETFLNNGGVVQHQLATQGNDARIAGGVLARFGNFDLQNRAPSPTHPIVAGLPWVLEGNWANHNYFTNLPPGAQVITETSIGHFPTTVEYSYGAGKVIATGMTWEFLYQFGYPAGPILTQATAYSLSQVRPRWVRLSAQAATIPPGASQNIQVTFDSNGLPGGGYDAAIRLTSNDPDEALVNVAAHLEVVPRSDIDVSPAALSFGTVFIGASRQDSAVVSNVGVDRLDVFEVSSSNADFMPDSGSFSLAPGQRRAIQVTYRPSAPGLAQGTFLVRSNDPDEPEVSVALSGSGAEPPVAAVSPASLISSLLSGASETQTLRISNLGASDLLFEVSARASAPESPPPDSSQAASSGAPGPTANDTNPTPGGPGTASIYEGTHVRFGITNYGEVMPFQYPLGNEHLQIGAYRSGYVLAYIAGGTDRVRFTLNDFRSGIAPYSYQELENSPSTLIVKVVARTTDGLLEIQRLFTFRRSEKTLSIETRLLNLSGQPLGDVVFKDAADWDVDTTVGGDIWDYDRPRNMVFAHDTRYVAIAGGEAPAQMDLYGWNDLQTRETVVDFPTGPVGPIDGLEVLHYELGTLQPSQSREVLAVYGGGDTLEELQLVIDRASVPDWLSFNPVTGTVPPGSSIDVAVQVSAVGLIGGDYSAGIVVRSNDPIRPSLAVPVSLHVTGAPAIRVEPPTLDFGQVFIGATASLDFAVLNDGSDLLSVSAITSDDGEYSVDATAFTVIPGASHVVRVTFAPTAEGARPAGLSIAHNAAGSPTLIAVSGVAAVPPDIAVSPTSMSAALFVGETTVQNLSVTNAGAGNLTLQIAVRGLGAFPGSGSPPVPSPLNGTNSEVLTDASPVPMQVGASDVASVLVIQDTDAWGLNMAAFLMSRFGIAATVISSSQIASTDFLPYDLIITVGDEGLSYYSALTLHRPKFEDFLSRGGVVQYQLATQGGSLDIAGGVHVQYGNLEIRNAVLLPTHPIVAGLPATLLGDYANHCYLTNLPAGAQVITETFSSHVPTTAEYTVGQGRVIVTGMTWEFLYTYGFQAGLMLFQATEYSLSLALPQWLSVNPTTATIPSGTTLDVAVTFDATQLVGGPYNGFLQLESNDPDERVLSVPVHLDVTGSPDIALSTTALGFGGLFVGLSRQDSIVVSNTGSDLLNVTEVVTTHGDFTPDVGSFSLPPGLTRVVRLTFRPSSLGSIEGSLVLRSNDADEGEVSVAVSGAGIAPPVVSIAPTSIHSDLALNRTETRTLALGNTGGSDLTFTLFARNGAESVMVHEGATLAKGEADPRSGEPIAAGFGGPDQFGYHWTDSDDASGPPFAWVEISGVGTRLPIGGDDQTSAPIPIGFSFPFYGNPFSYVNVSTNGFLSFTSPSAQYTNQPLPSPTAPENMIAAFWDDLYVYAGPTSGVFVHSDATRMVIQYQRVYLLSGEGPYTFEMILFPSGVFLIQYLSMNGPSDRSTVGFQNAIRDDGLTIAFNTPYLHNNLAIRCAAAPTWLSVSPEAGTVPPGSTLPLQATLTTVDLPPGNYAATIQVDSNDPLTPHVKVPVTLRVLGVVSAAASQIDPNTLNLDSNGRRVNAYVELPAGLDPNQVLLPTVRFQGTIPCSQDALMIGDFNLNGTPDLHFQFDRAAVEQILPEGDQVAVVVTGDVANTSSFVARDSIRVIRPRVLSPNGGEVLRYGSLVSITWENPTGWQVDYADLYYSADDGESWTRIAQGVTGQSVAWFVPPVTTTTARIRVYLYDADGVMGYDSSDQVFEIQQLITGVAAEEAPPLVHALFQNSPNPFNPRTSIRFDLPAPSPVRLTIFSVDGRVVRTLVDRSMPAGRHRVVWDGKNGSGKDVGSGVYYYKMDAGSFRASRALLLLK